MNIPVFDIGDTLTPAKQFSRDFFQEYMISKGVRNPPEYPFSKYNEFKVEDLEIWLESEEIGLDPREMRDAYLEAKTEQMEQSGVLEELRKISEEISPIGILSDNSLEARRYFMEIFRNRDIKFDGFVVSEEISVKKPDSQIFEEFLDRRGVEAGRCVYFGNRGDIDSSCEDVGMGFVFVTSFHNFGTDYNGNKLKEITLENVRRFCQ